MILLALIHCCACLMPSVLSAIYFLISLGLVFWWALGKHFGQAYLYIVRFLQIYSLSHLLLIYLYQLSFVEEYLSKQTPQLVRLLGLQALYPSFCFERPSKLNNCYWIIYLHPFTLLFFYWITIYEHHFSQNYQEQVKTVLSTYNNSEISSTTNQHTTLHLHSFTDLFWMS